jgi:hypothetical protein
MTTPPLPSWATRQAGGPPAPGSPADLQLAAFVGPRWATYRRKFRPFFDDARFTPTWNWAAALLFPAVPVWFLYRKLYLPFAFFTMLPTLAFGLLWRSGELPVREVPSPIAGGRPLTTLTPDALLLALGVLVSTAILAGGTANFLLYRRAITAVRVIAARAPGGDAATVLLRKVGGTSWQAVGVGLTALFLLRLLTAVVPS